MEKQYYTPNIEDLFIGYECEVDYGYFTNAEMGTWSKNIFKGIDKAVIEYLSNGYYRTPYLTKDQIEAEGWIYTGESIDIWFKKEGNFQIGNWTSYKIVLHYNLKDYRLFIYADDTTIEHPLFESECLSINEFRYICKLLKIN